MTRALAVRFVTAQADTFDLGLARAIIIGFVIVFGVCS